MKKKEYKKKIKDLELQIGLLESRLKIQEDLHKYNITRITETLLEHGVLMEIILPEPPIIETNTCFDFERKFVRGISTEQPRFKFDFTEHDEDVLKKGCK